MYVVYNFVMPHTLLKSPSNPPPPYTTTSLSNIETDLHFCRFIRLFFFFLLGLVWSWIDIQTKRASIEAYEQTIKSHE